MLSMSSFTNNKCYFLIIFFLPFIISNPVYKRDTLYDKFIYFLSKKNCTMPKELKHPFQQSSESSPFSFLSAPLQECRTLDALKENDEANMLCIEVFEVLKNITCAEYEEPLHEIDSTHLSANVCSDFESMKDIFPERSDYLSRKLSDGLICKILCTADKYELLCKTLLWSYDTLAKIKGVSANEVQENEKEIINTISSDKGSSTIKLSLANPESVSNGLQKNELAQQTIVDSLHASNVNYSESQLPDSKISTGHDENILQNTLNEKDPSNHKIKDEAINKTDNILKSDSVVTSASQNKTEIGSQQVFNDEHLKITDSNNLSNLNDHNNHVNDDDNEINVDEQPGKIKENEKITHVNSDTNTLMPNIGQIKDNQYGKNLSLNIVSQNKEQDKENFDSNIDTKTNGKPEESTASIVGADNELNNINFPEQENKSKTKESDLKTQGSKEVENSKLADYETPNEDSPDNDSKLAESSTLQVFPDENVEPQEDKDQDQYNDAFNLPIKNREPDVKSSITVGSNHISNNYDNFNSRNNIGHLTEDIPMIPTFPEQEDSHFFFYFLSIVLIIMAGYLIFHNKQKIIALIVEGRHERRRRSHGAGYKKLETK